MGVCHGGVQQRGVTRDKRPVHDAVAYLRGLPHQFKKQDRALCLPATDEWGAALLSDQFQARHVGLERHAII